MSNQNNQIPVAPFKQLAKDWDTARSSYQDTISLVQAGSPSDFHSFNLSPNIQLLLPPSCVNVHAYMVCDPSLNNLQMVLISDVEDLAIANGATTIPQEAICTLDYTTTAFPSYLPPDYLERIDRWQNNQNVWVQAVVAAGAVNNEDGVVQVFEIPVADLQSVLGFDSQVFLALKTPNLVETSVEVICYKPGGSEQFFDISTPIPPYGGKGHKFGLLM